MIERCGKPCEVWTRVTGFYRPVQQWNDAKREEFDARQMYTIEGDDG